MRTRRGRSDASPGTTDHYSRQPRPLSDPMVPLLMLFYDFTPDFRICDVGELQFYTKERDLQARNLALVEVQMQGG
jgi:hypothetical protein